MQKVRWGIIGIGGIASRRLAPEVVQIARNAELVAVMGPNAERTKAAAERFGVAKWYTHEADLLAAPAVEAVYVATPNHLHREQVIAAAQAGKHVLCEKPLGLSVAEAEAMAAACRDSGVLLGVGFMMRFQALHWVAARMIADGALGKPVFARAQLSCWYPPIEGAWRQQPGLGGGGCLADMGTHCIDVLEMLLGSRAVEVSTTIATVVHGYPVEDTSAVTLRFANGAIGVVDNSFAMPDAASRNRLEVYGSLGSLLAEGTIGQASGGTMVATLDAQSSYAAAQDRDAAGGVPVEAEPVPMYAAEIDHMSECIRAGREPEIGAEVGLHAQRVLDACYKSARTGRAVGVM